MSRAPIDQARWQPWIDHVCAAVGVDPELVDVRWLHRITGEVATVYTRPMAPVAAHLLGLAEGSGVGPSRARQAIRDAAEAAAQS